MPEAIAHLQVDDPFLLLRVGTDTKPDKHASTGSGGLVQVGESPLSFISRVVAISGHDVVLTADLVNAAYGLTAEEMGLMWRTAPPRMPCQPPPA